MIPPTGTAAREAEEYLAEVFATCTGFELAVVTSAEPSSREILRERLAADGADLRVLAPGVEAMVEAPLLDASLAGHRSLVLWFESDDDDDEPDWRAFAVALNRAREQLRTRHSYLWVLAGPLSLRRLMTVHAQDIYSVAYKAPHITAHVAAQIDWLHISDLQLHQKGDSRLREAFLSDLQRTLEREALSTDLVLITGDLAAHGEPEQYAQVDRFLDALCETLAGHNGVVPIVMAVPGNHDLTRRNARTLRRYDRTDPHVEELWELLWSEKDTSFIEPLFRAYLDWARRRIWSQTPDLAGMKPGVCYLRDRFDSYFPGDGAMVVEKDDLRAVVVGLNTAWTSFRGGDTGELAIEQFDAALAGLDPSSIGAHTGVLLTHHGPEALSSEAREQLEGLHLRDAGIAVHLHGHAQAAGLVAMGKRLRIAGVPLFGARAPRAYTLGRLKHGGRVQVWYRSMSSRDDKPVYFDHRPGAVLEQLESHDASPELVSTDELARYLLRSRYAEPRATTDDRPVIEMRLSSEAIDHAPPWGPQETFAAAMLFTRARERGARAIVLRGAKGSGKTTLIQTLSDVLEREGPVALGLPAGTVPLFLTIEQLAAPHVTLPDLVQSKAGDLAPDFGRRLCERGRLLLVLDGLADADAELRARVVAWLESTLAQLRESTVLVTDAANLGPLDERWFELHLCPFDDRQVAHCLRERSTLIEWLFEPGRGPHERVLELARRPGFVWMIIGWWLAGMQNWPLLVRMCSSDSWRSTPDNAPALDDALEALAAQIHETRGRRWIPETEVSVAYEGLQVDGSWLIDQLLAHGDHLARRDGEIGFVHLAIQEHLTASWWWDRVREDEGAWAQLAARFDDCWWHEVIATLLEDEDAFVPFMNALVRRPEFPIWSQTAMMRRCLTLSGASPTPFVAVVRGLEGLVEAPPARIEARGGIELIRVPGGRARLGSTASELGHRLDEAPVHEVELDDFYIAPTPVTNADYARYLRCNPDAPIPRYWSDRRFNQPEQPVVGVSWAEAEAYCEWAGLALPTEAQWEHACRAGATTRFCAGDNEAELARVGWYVSNAETKLHVVRIRDPNALGLFDMHGNVREWCRDEFGSYQVAPRPGDGLRHPPREDGSRVHRGGSFRDSAEELRCAARRQALASYRLDALGFRPIASIASGATGRDT